jgi:hypothetical protein
MIFGNFDFGQNNDSAKVVTAKHARIACVILRSKRF